MLDFTPPETCRKFMLSEALVKCIVGPLGSGKSMTGIMELFRRACEQEPDEKGVRPTRFAIVRNTLAQLRETFLADCEQYLAEFFVHKVSTQTLQFRFTLPDKTKVVSDWLLMPLERPEDQRKLLSLNLTAALIEECREVPYDVVAALMGRIGRYPSMARVPPTWQSLAMISNPWSESSDYHTHFVVEKPKEWDLFRQPGGLDPEAENVENLPQGYYERLMDGHSDDWIKVHVHGMWGDDQFGQAVYRASFSREQHEWVDASRFICHPALPILIGLDFGRTPAAVLTQESVAGQITAFRELTTDDMNLRQFCEELLLPYLREHHPSNRVFIVGDPQGVARSSYSEDTAFKVLEEYGLAAIPAPTNDVPPRLRAVEKLLLDTRAGHPRFQVVSENCPRLFAGFLREYRYRKQRSGELTPLPEKNHASHIHDAMQYAALGHQSNYVGRRVLQAVQTKHGRAKPRPTALGWT